MKILIIYSPISNLRKLLKRVPRDVTALVFHPEGHKLTFWQRKHIHVLPADLTDATGNGVRLATLLQRLSKPEVAINLWLGGPQAGNILEDCIEHGDFAQVKRISVRWELSSLAEHIQAMRLQDACKRLVNLTNA